VLPAVRLISLPFLLSLCFGFLLLLWRVLVFVPPFFPLIYDLGTAAGDPSTSHLLLKKNK